MKWYRTLFAVATSTVSIRTDVVSYRWGRKRHRLATFPGQHCPFEGAASWSTTACLNVRGGSHGGYESSETYMASTPPDLPPPPPFYPSGETAHVDRNNQNIIIDPYTNRQQQQQPPYNDPRIPRDAHGINQAPPYGSDPNSGSFPLPPPLPDQFMDDGPMPVDDEDLEMPLEASTTGTTATAPWETTGATESLVSDMSSFDKDYILKGLARLYRKKILPLELSSKYGHFHSPPLSPSDFDAPPMILLLGQYSVGKTSFVKYLLGRDFPGIRIGPEPTTDRFTAILWGSQDKIIPGAALCSQTDRPFTGLSPMGNNFLSRMEAAEINSPILKNVTIIDTPGILSGQKQRSRNYDYDAVMKWFAERADLIIVMFDAHKLDISDELKAVMHLMIPHLDKIRIVLNKADSVSTQQLMRVYGALMWSLGKVMNTPEVSRVYMGSFWDAPLQCTEQAELLQREEMDLLHDIMALPQHAVMRRINELVKRARSVKVHAYIIHYLRKQIPYTPWAKKEKQKKLIDRLEAEFIAAARRYGLPRGDFPSIEPMRNALYEIKDLSEFPKLDKKLVREMDKVFSVDVPELLERAKNH
jgi:GTPase SAR1 family protein